MPNTSQEIFQLLFKNNPIPMWIYDIQTLAFLAVNDLAVDHYGYSREEFLSMTIKDIRVPEEVPYLLEVLEKHIGQIKKVGLTRHSKKDGTIIIADITSYPIEFDNHPAMFVLATDVTEQKLQEKEIRQRAEELATLNTLSRQINQSIIKDDLIDVVVHGILTSVQPDLVVLFQCEGDKLTLQKMETAENIRALENVPVHLVGHCICGLAVRDRKNLYSKNIFADTRCTWDECKKAGFRSFAALPLHVEQTMIGVLGLASKQERNFETQAEFLDTLASHVAIALQNARLYRVLKEELSERKHTENLLIESDKSYSNLVNASPVGMHLYQLDSGGKLIFIGANPAADKILGIDNKQFIGKTIEEAFPPLAETEIPDRYRAAAKNGEMWSTEQISYEHGLIKGAFEVTAFQISAGKMAATFSEITERKRMEDALRESEQKFRALFEQIADGVVVADILTHKILIVNHQFCQMIGYQFHELVGTGIESIHPESEYLNIKKQFDLLAREEIELAQNIPVKCKDGSILYADISAGLIEINGNACLVGLFRDITDRKRTEEKIAEQARLLEVATDAIIVRDMNNQLLFWNASAEKLYGWTFEEARSLSIQDLVSENDVSRYMQGLQDILQNGKWEGELHQTTKDGRTILTYSHWTLVRDNNEKPLSRLIIIRDITEQRALESRLRQTQRLENLGTLAGGIAHDFNNILGIILAFSTSLERMSEDKKKVVEYGNMITQAVNRGASLVRQILTFARQTDVLLAPLNVTNLILELISMLEQTFPKIIRFTKNIDNDIPFINADRTQIHQALLNLCVNARDAMPHGGTISIKTEKHTKEQVQKKFPAANQELYICIRVSDTGLGMEESTRHRIFDPFFTTKDPGKGTGLGLAVVYGVVQSHNGFIDVESKLGSGTTFWIFLPAFSRIDAQDDVSEISGGYNVGGTETILIVEDEDRLTQMLSIFLEEKGYKVYVANDGNSAVELYQRYEKEIALVLSDLGLPGMTGMEEFEKLKEINPDVKIIFTSGFFELDIKQDLAAKGAKAFIQKPYSSDEILSKVREVLDEKI